MRSVALVGATNRPADLDAALLSRFDVRVHFAAPEAPGRADIFALYAKHLPREQLVRLGEAAKGLSGRDILDVCRQAERRWVVKKLKGEVLEPLLPPLPQYEATLRRRLESSSQVEDDGRGGADATASNRGAVAAAAARRRGVATTSAVSLGPNSVVAGGRHWADQPFNEGRSMSGIRPPGW